MAEGNIFEELEDNRQDWKVKHSMTEIMIAVMCGMSAGEMSVYGIQKFAKIKEKRLKEVTKLKYENRRPSYDTVKRTLGAIPPPEAVPGHVHKMDRGLAGEACRKLRQL